MSTEHMPTIRVLEVLSVLAAENTGFPHAAGRKTGILKGTLYPILKTSQNAVILIMTKTPSFIFWVSPAPFFPVHSLKNRTG